MLPQVQCKLNLVLFVQFLILILSSFHKIINIAKNPTSGSVEPDTINFIKDLVTEISGENIPPEYLFNTISLVLNSIKTPRNVEINGHRVPIMQINSEAIKLFKELYSSLPKADNEKLNAQTASAIN